MNIYIKKGLWVNFTNHSLERFKERILSNNESDNLSKDILKDFSTCIEIDFSKDKVFWEKQMSKVKDYEKAHVFFHPQNGHFYLIIANTITNIKTCVTVIKPDESYMEAHKGTLYKAYYNRIERKEEKQQRKEMKQQEINRKKHCKGKWDSKFKESFFNRHRERKLEIDECY